MTAEDREIARTAPDWWTGADVSQQTELPLVERLRKVSCYTRAFSFSGPHNRTANAIDEAIAMLEAERGRADAAERDAASKQARIDELMLE